MDVALTRLRRRTRAGASWPRGGATRSFV